MRPDDAAEPTPIAVHPPESPTAAVVRHDGGGSCVAIRSISPNDVPAYIELLRRIDRESQFLAWEPGERQFDVDVLRIRIGQADPSNRLHLVATHYDEFVGFLVSHRGLTRRLRHRADFTMAVLQRFHRRGIGWRLLAALHAWAAAQHIDRVELTVMSHNSAAIALYRRAGYHEEGLKRGSIRLAGEPVDEIVMGKAIEQHLRVIHPRAASWRPAPSCPAFLPAQAAVPVMTSAEPLGSAPDRSQQ